MTPDEREALREQLRRQDPEPFRDLLLDALEQKPTAEDWRKLAATAPDKFVKATKQLGGLIGFTENLVVKHTHQHLIEVMSDSQLIDYIREKRKALPLPVIDAVAEPVETEGGPAQIGPSAADLRDAKGPRPD